MTITREQVADLQPGDVVELMAKRWGQGVVVRGALRDVDVDGNLACGPILVRFDGEPATGADDLTVVSRAPRPLYVNHPRTEPVPGDIVRDADSDDPMRVWLTSSNEDGYSWWVDCNAEWVNAPDLPARLRLLVDGETGQVVQ